MTGCAGCVTRARDVVAMAAVLIAKFVGDVEELKAAYDRAPTPIAQLAAIDLTSVRQDPTRLAEWAVGAAIERLDAGRTERRELVLEPEDASSPDVFA